MRKQCKRKVITRCVTPLIFKHCESAEIVAEEWKDRIVVLYFSMLDHKFTDDDCGVVIEFFTLCAVIGSVAKNDGFDEYVTKTIQVMYAPYRRRTQNGRWIFTTDETEDLRERMIALVDAIAALPKLTIKFAMHDVHHKQNRFYQTFRANALNTNHHAA